MRPIYIHSLGIHAVIRLYEPPDPVYGVRARIAREDDETGTMYFCTACDRGNSDPFMICPNCKAKVEMG